MFKLVLALLCLSAVAYSADNSTGVNWALIVAGSNGYYNYRHQADVCHAYQILHKNGIPDERIITMMYDDIAQSEENPTKGMLINRPNGPDVYKGVPKDYTGDDVTPDNFLKALQGQKTSTGGKVIKSGPNDNVFVFFSDHGAPDLVAFPNDVLHATPLNDAIKNMFKAKQYKNLVFYIEACESGSMFENLLDSNMNVFATTASNSAESSYACYYDDVRATYLGDLYSVSWMEDSDKQNVWTETLDAQFKRTRAATNLSHVLEFGDITLSKTFPVGDFQGEKSSRPLMGDIMDYETPSKADAVKTVDVRVSVLEKKLAKETDNLKKEKIYMELAHATKLKRIATGVTRSIVEAIFETDGQTALKMIETKSKITKRECYQAVIEHLLNKCFSVQNEYVLRQFYVMVNICEHGVKVEKIKSAIETTCPKRFED